MTPRAPSHKKVTAADIKAALLDYYAPPAHRVFFEVSNDTGAKARRWVDAVALGIWPSTGYEIVGIEIKVSRSDLRAELADPRKAQELMRFCSRWCLAAPAGMVRPDELPRTWGLLEFDAGRMRRKVAPPLLEPEGITPGFMMAILRKASSVDPELVEKIAAERIAKLRESVDREIECGIKMRADDVTHRNQQAEKLAAELAAVTGTPVHEWDFDKDALAAAYILFKQTGLHRAQAWGFGELLGAAENLRKVAVTIQTVCEDEKFAAIRARLDGARAARKGKRR